MSWLKLGRSFDRVTRKGKLGMVETLRAKTPKRSKDSRQVPKGELDDPIDDLFGETK